MRRGICCVIAFHLVFICVQNYLGPGQEVEINSSWIFWQYSGNRNSV